MPASSAINSLFSKYYHFMWICRNIPDIGNELGSNLFGTGSSSLPSKAHDAITGQAESRTPNPQLPWTSGCSNCSVKKWGSLDLWRVQQLVTVRGNWNAVYTACPPGKANQNAIYTLVTVVESRTPSTLKFLGSCVWRHRASPVVGTEWRNPSLCFKLE